MRYYLPLKYFLIMTLLLLISGLWMFGIRTQFNIEGISSYYSLKSFYGTLETVTPHLFGMGLIIFIITHFFAITKNREANKQQWLSLLLFLLILVLNISSFLIASNSFWLASIKLIGLSLFVVYTLVATWRVWKI